VNDTSAEIDELYRSMLLRRSGGCSMHAMAQALVRASVLEKDPLASPVVLRYPPMAFTEQRIAIMHQTLTRAPATSSEAGRANRRGEQTCHGMKP